MDKQQSPSPGVSSPSAPNKTASILMIQPLENVNKELLYHQRMNRPFKVIQNLPVSKSASELPDYTTMKHPLSVKDSAVLYNSLIVSRFNWIHHIFKTYWTRREQVIRGVDMNKKDKMVRFCNPVLSCSVHTFKVKLFFLKEDEREKAFRVEIEKRKEERLKRRREKLEEMQRRREEKEREEKEKELEREKLKETYLTKMQEDKESLKKEEEYQSLQSKQQAPQPSQSQSQLLPHEVDQHKLLSTHQQQRPQESELMLQPQIKNQPPQQSQPTEKKEMDLGVNSEQIQVQNLKNIAPSGDTQNREETSEVASNTEKVSKPTIKFNQDQPGKKESESKSDETERIQSLPKATHSDSTNFAKTDSDRGSPSSSTASNTKNKSKPDTKDIMSNPESAIMIQNLNVLAKQDPHLNVLMKKVASGSASTEQILEFQKYIQKAKEMGDVTGYMAKLKQKQKEAKANARSLKKAGDTRSKEEIEAEKQRKKKEKLAKLQSAPIIKPVKLTPEEAKKREEDLLKRAMEMKQEQERLRLEKQRLREEREREKIRLKQERIEQKAREKEEKERLKQLAKKEREQEKEQKRQEKLAEKERARREREERQKEKQLQREKEKVEQKSKSKSDFSGKNNDDDDDDENDEYDDRMAKLNNGDDDEDDDLWNDKLSPLQERYNTGASLVFEFIENPASRFTIPRDTIYELIDNDEEENENEDLDGNISGTDVDATGKIKNENEASASHPKSPYITVLASFLLVHNQKEIDGWERRQAEVKAAKEEKEKKRLEALKAEEEEASKNTIAENARKRRRKRSTWSSSNKRATRASKQAKEIEQFRREEENFHEEDDELRNASAAEDLRPIPVYSCVTMKLSKIPFRFTSFVLESGNNAEERRKNMEETIKIGTRLPLSQLWYQIDGIKDELLGETLRYNLNRLDYLACGGKKSKALFLKKFGKGGRG